MWNQPEEYFIEAVSNASMDVFPENTLTKFSNKLARPIDLVGDWVVGIQEIFYPTDINVTARTTSLSLLTSNSSKTSSVEFSVKATDDLSTVVKKINDAIKTAYASAKSKRVKREALNEFHALLATNVSQLSDNEKIVHLGKMMQKGSSAFTGLIAKITKLTKDVGEKDTKIQGLSDNVKLAERHLEKLNNELKLQKDTAIEFEKYKMEFENRLESYLEQVNALKTKNSKLENDSQLESYKVKLEKQQKESEEYKQKFVDKKNELIDVQEQIRQCYKKEEERVKFWNKYVHKARELSEDQISKLKEEELNRSKSDEEIAEEITKIREEQATKIKTLENERENEKVKFENERIALQEKENLLKQQLNQLKTTNENLNATIDQLKIDLESKIPASELHKATADLVAMRSEKNKIKTELEKVNNNLTDQVKRLMEALTKEQELNLKEKQNNENEKTKLKNMIDHEKNRSKQLQQQIATKIKEISDIQNACSKTKVDYESNMKQWNVHYEKIREEAEKETEKLQKELESFKSHEAKVQQENIIKKLKEKHDAEIASIKNEIDREKKNFEKQIKFLQDQEAVKQQQLQQFEADTKILHDTIERLIAELEIRAPIEHIQKLKDQIAEVNAAKISVEKTNITLQEKQLALTAELAKLKNDIAVNENAREKLVKEISEVKEDLYKLKPQVNYDIEMEEEDQIPVIEIEGDGFIKIKRGYLKKKVVMPYFTDPAFLQSLGFDIYSFQTEIARLMTSEIFIKGDKKANFDLKAHLMFVYSDIVGEHFVGDKSARVLRVLPIRHNGNNELVHERFMKPFYYPIRSNRVEQINFILTDETGDTVKFNSGRVLIGLHLKKVV